MALDVLALALELRQRGEPFALATVVRCERPTSAKPGAKALVRGDGTLAGWVGGACAEPVVVREALAALRDGQPRLLSLAGEGARGPGHREGVLEYPMSCHSGGTLEIYVEPVLPKPSLVLIGHGPALDTLAALGRAIELDVVVVDPRASPEALRGIPLGPRAHVVVATHGESDEDALVWALGGSAGYVSLVASRKRASAVLARLKSRGVAAERLGRLTAPAGLDIGATTPEEIAVSILAEIVQVRRSPKRVPEDDAGEVVTGTGEATDPICGMRVEIATARHRSDAPDGTVYFCCRRCKETFDRAG